MLRCLLISLAAASILLTALSVHAFEQPRSAFPLNFKIVTERLETMDIPRVRLDGRRQIQMDSPTDLERASRNKTASFALQRRFVPSCKFELFVYPNSAIPGGISSGSVSSYLRGMSNDAARKKEFFEIITPPEPDGGKTTIRFLGTKPITVRYAVSRIIDGEPTRVIIQDSWASVEGETYLLRIEAPENLFDSFAAQSRSLANTMFFID